MRLVERSAQFFQADVWSIRREDVRGWRRAVIDVVRTATIVAERYFADLCTTRASALTFTSLLALVPVLALAFAVLRGLGWQGERFEALILNKVTLLSPEAIATIVSYVDNVNFTGLGVVGGAFLLITFVSVVTSVETAFNAIWDNVAARRIGRRVTDYFGVIVVAPVLLIVAMSLTAALQSNRVFVWLRTTWGIGTALEWVLGYAAWPVVWLLFAFLYVYVPNTRVRLVPALFGAVIAGTVWQVTQWAYIRFQLGVANYNAVYGALAQLPMLMAWLYASWAIVLLGAEITHAVQILPVYSREKRTSTRSGQAFKEWIALGIAVELARAALEHTQAPTHERLAQLFDVPPRTVRDVLASLECAGLAHSAVDERCYLSLSPELVTVARVLDAIRGTVPHPQAHPLNSDSARSARAVLEGLHKDARRAIGARTLCDIVGEAEPASRLGHRSEAERPATAASAKAPTPASAGPEPARAGFGREQKGHPKGPDGNP